MLAESSVQALCARIEKALRASSQAIDALYMAQCVDDQGSAHLSELCYACLQFCVEASNRAREMAHFNALSLEKLAALHALYQRLGGKEPRLVREQATTLALCAQNDAVFLTPPPSMPRAPLKPDVAQLFAQERAAMRHWLQECTRIQEQDETPPDSPQCDDAQDEEVRALPLFALSGDLAALAHALAQQRLNLRHVQSNVVQRYAACARLYEAAQREPEPPSTMASMFLPV